MTSEDRRRGIFGRPRGAAARSSKRTTGDSAGWIAARTAGVDAGRLSFLRRLGGRDDGLDRGGGIPFQAVIDKDVGPLTDAQAPLDDSPQGVTRRWVGQLN